MQLSAIEKNYIERAKATFKAYPRLTEVCRVVLDSMWTMKDELKVAIKMSLGAKELPPYQQFVSIYFFRNLSYLRPIYLLGCEGCYSPAADLQRTVYETILKGYLFLADREEANHFYSCIEGTATLEQQRDSKKQFYRTKFLRNQLFNSVSAKSHGDIWRELSLYSHPNLKGAIRDLEGYSAHDVEDCLKMFLMLAYGNIQMMAEGFFDLLTPNLRKTIKRTLQQIADFLGEIPLFEPDQKRWASKIKLKKGNFLKLL